MSIILVYIVFILYLQNVLDSIFFFSYKIVLYINGESFMRHLQLLLAATLFLSSTTLNALSDGGCEGITKTQNPFFLTGFYDYIGKSKFEDHDDRGRIRYATGGVELTSFVYYNPDHKEGITVGLNYTTIKLDWSKNHYFDQKTFNDAGIRLGAFSGRLCNWMWKGFINYTLDTTHSNFTYYSLWDFAAWGKYQYCDTLELSVGFYAQTGMKADRVWPVIGFDWQYSDRISISAVFPNDMRVMYMINDCWSTGGCLNFYRNRARTGRDEPESRGIWVYENSGIEWCLDYDKNELTYVSLHAGYTFGGELKITDKNYDKRHHMDFKGAPFAGGRFGVKF